LIAFFQVSQENKDDLVHLHPELIKNNTELLSSAAVESKSYVALAFVDNQVLGLNLGIVDRMNFFEKQFKKLADPVSQRDFCSET